MFKTIGLALVIFVGAVLLYASTRPDSFRIERSISIQSTPKKIFPLINNFHQWEAWSPWEGIDPRLKRTYSGAHEGKGSVYGRSGNKDIGQGRMEITEYTLPAKITIKLDFIAPFEAHNAVDFVLTPQGNATLVRQTMYGPSPFISKLMGLVFSMEKMVGDKYEEGLNNLKKMAEK
jgi:hypothetical protein